jgi:ATP-dependent Lon protease
MTDDAVRDLIRYYTREAGVRNLEREIANLARKAVKEILMKGKTKVIIGRKNLEKYAGVPKFRYGEAELEDLVGITTGLAWTEVGGELLSIEAVLVPGKGKHDGDRQARRRDAGVGAGGQAYVRSARHRFGIKPTIFEKRDIHVHVPEGATPKDGPSAGVAMVTSIVSAADRHPGAQGRGHDRRDHAARPGAADRRLEGEAAGGAARRVSRPC